MKSWFEPNFLPRLSAEEKSRYARHLILPQVGEEGQSRLKAARVLIAGAGGLGSPVALYLAAAGVGCLGIVDADEVDETNLQRQILYDRRDVGMPKIVAAGKRLRAINPHIEVEEHFVRLSRHNALDLLARYDIIVDGTDNFQTRYLINDACVFLGKPDVYGSVLRFEGQVGVFWAKHGACYRCLYPQPPAPEDSPACHLAGVLGVLPGLVGTFQATEVIKLILGAEDVLLDRLLLVDAWGARVRELRTRRDPHCALCGEKPTQTDFIDYDHFCAASADWLSWSSAELRDALNRGAAVDLVDVREPEEFEIERIDRARNIPLGEVLERMGEFNPVRDTVMICKMGVRSAQAIRMLRSAGYQGRLINLDQGMLGWRKSATRPEGFG